MISLSLQENKNFNDELMNLISNDCESDDDDVCLIDGMDLEDDYITLSCKHKFNYLSLLHEIISQKQKNHLETQHIGSYEIKCPYCRHIHKGVLPYKESLHSIKRTGVNWPPSKVLKTNHCGAILRSGKRKGECCGKLCLEEYCPIHLKAIQKRKEKAAAKEEKQIILFQKLVDNGWIKSNNIITNQIINATNTTNATNATNAANLCSAIIKSGKRKGQVCGCKCKKNNSKCGRHIIKKSI